MLLGQHKPDEIDAGGFFIWEKVLSKPAAVHSFCI